MDASELELEPLEETLSVDGGVVLEAMLKLNFYDDAWKFKQLSQNLAGTQMDQVDRTAAILDQWFVTHKRRLDQIFDFLPALVPATITEVKYAFGFALVEICDEIELLDEEEEDTADEVEADDEP